MFWAIKLIRLLSNSKWQRKNRICFSVKWSIFHSNKFCWISENSTFSLARKKNLYVFGLSQDCNFVSRPVYLVLTLKRMHSKWFSVQHIVFTIYAFNTFLALIISLDTQHSRFWWFVPSHNYYINTHNVRATIHFPQQFPI